MRRRAESTYSVTVKRGAVIHTVDGKWIYLEWPDGRLTLPGKGWGSGPGITREEADRLVAEAKA